MKKALVIALIFALMIMLTSCSQSEKVTYNLRREADEFNVRRRITVLNTRTDTPMMQIMTLADELFYVDEADYGVTWRCWTSCPTDAQRKAVKWYGEDA